MSFPLSRSQPRLRDFAHAVISWCRLPRLPFQPRVAWVSVGGRPRFGLCRIASRMHLQCRSADDSMTAPEQPPLSNRGTKVTSKGGFRRAVPITESRSRLAEAAPWQGTELASLSLTNQWGKGLASIYCLQPLRSSENSFSLSARSPDVVAFSGSDAKFINSV